MATHVECTATVHSDGLAVPIPVAVREHIGMSSKDEWASRRFLTLQQAAEELNTGEGVLRNMIRSCELPAIQVGGRGQWRIERVVLEDYIECAYMRSAKVEVSGRNLGGVDRSDGE